MSKTVGTSLTQETAALRAAEAQGTMLTGSPIGKVTLAADSTAGIREAEEAGKALLQGRDGGLPGKVLGATLVNEEEELRDGRFRPVLRRGVQEGGKVGGRVFQGGGSSAGGDLGAQPGRRLS